MTLGQVLKGRYRIAERIGSGGMSTVYLAHVVDTGQSVAVKVVNEALAFDEQYARRFAQELAIARLLDHPGIPRLIDDGQTEEGVPFLVLEYVQGITLTEYLRKKGPLPIEEAVAIASSVLTILSYAYSKGIQAHRDIKPGNIMIDLRTHAVTVMDFGIAKTVGSSLTHSTVLYTPRYAAPEQLLPSKFGGVVDKRADLYALGVVLYEMLTGRVPFAGETPAEISGEQITSPPPSPSSIRRDIPAPLSQILLTCLQANPSHRYQTPQDLLQDLREGRPSSTRETTETVIRKEPSLPLRREPSPPSEHPAPHRMSRALVPYLLTLLVAGIVLVTVTVQRNKGGTPMTGVTSTSLTITSTPPGAQVSLNGTSIGTTPIATKTVTPGTYTLLFTLSGYEDYRETVTLSAGDTRQVNAPLTKKAVVPTTATLAVTSTPPGAQVFLDGTSIGTTPLAKNDVTPGTYIVLLTLSGYEDYRETITLSAGDTGQVNAPLTKKAVVPTTTTLTVTSTPSGAQVFLDGKDTGKVTPSTFVLAPGSHDLKVTQDGYLAWDGAVGVGPAGNTQKFDVSLTKFDAAPTAATLTVTSTPTGAQVTLDGSYIGVTPVSIVVSQGPHGVRVTLSGYEDQTTSFVVGSVPYEVDIALEEKRSYVSVASSPSGAEVLLDGTYLGTTPISQMAVQPGSHRVEIKMAGYSDYLETVTVSRGSTLPIRATLSRLLGILSISSVPSGASVSVDGVAKGVTPLTLIMDPGAYAVKIVREGYQEWGKTVAVEASASALLDSRLVPYFTSVAAGYDHSLGIARDGSLWAWGRNSSGQLGDGTTTDRSFPVRIGTRTDWKAVAAGSMHSLALAGDGSLWAWGSNIYGQLGDGTTTGRFTPVRISASTGWTGIAAGFCQSFAIASDGSLWSCGTQSQGVLGRQGPSFALTQVGGLKPTSVATGFYLSVCVWGGDLWECGNGWTETFKPIDRREWSSVAVGEDHGLALASDGSLWEWRQLGNLTRVGDRTDWVTMAGGGGAFSVALSVAIDRSGFLWAWQGIGATPVRVSDRADWAEVSAADDQVLALARDGSVWQWSGGFSSAPVRVGSGG